MRCRAPPWFQFAGVMPWLVLSLGSRSSIPNLPEPSDALNPSLTECRATDNRFENRPRVLPIKHIGTLVGAVTMTEISPFSAAETARSVSAKLFQSVRDNSGGLRDLTPFFGLSRQI